jgi:hypothetical protein
MLFSKGKIFIERQEVFFYISLAEMTNPYEK